MPAARRSPRLRFKTPVVREHPLHQQIVDVLRLELAPPGHISPQGVVWWSIDHAAPAEATDSRWAAWLKARARRGCIPGVADLFVLWTGRAYLIELKAMDGALSLDQRAVAAAVLEAGGRYGVARSAAETLALLDAWGVPRARRVRMAA